jgi:hypothetical protein
MAQQKVLGALQSPKGMAFGLKRPNGVLNAAFHWSSSLMQMLLNP